MAEVDPLIAKYGLGRHGHSHFSPSSSAGWLNCAGFLLANAVRTDMAGYDAAYGTVAHEIAANWLKARKRDPSKAELVPAAAFGTIKVVGDHSVTVDETMLHHIRRYVDWCAEVEILGDVHIEQYVEYSDYMPIPEQGGTADHFVCTKDGTLIITDLKMGTGVRVFVESNSQAMLYALGVYLEWNWFYGFKKVIIRICQPRLDYFGVWECTVADLLAFGEVVRSRAALAWAENAPRTPSTKACQWCNEIACPAKSALLEDLTDDKFSDDVPTYDHEAMEAHIAEKPPLMLPRPKAGYLTNEDIALMAWRYQHRAMMEKWFRQMGETLLGLAQAGVPVPGWKIVNGRRSYDWTDADKAAEELSVAGLPEEMIFKTEVTSVAKAREYLKTVGKTTKEIEALFFDEGDGLVKTTQGKPTLAPVKDDRLDVEDAADLALGA